MTPGKAFLTPEERVELASELRRQINRLARPTGR